MKSNFQNKINNLTSNAIPRFSKSLVNGIRKIVMLKFT